MLSRRIWYSKLTLQQRSLEIFLIKRTSWHLGLLYPCPPADQSISALSRTQAIEMPVRLQPKIASERLLFLIKLIALLETRKLYRSAYSAMLELRRIRLEERYLSPGSTSPRLSLTG